MCARKQVVTADDVQSERHVLGRLVVPVVHTLVTLVQHNVCCLVKALEHALLCARRDESRKKESIGHLPHVAAPMCAHVCVCQSVQTTITRPSLVTTKTRSVVSHHPRIPARVKCPLLLGESHMSVYVCVFRKPSRYGSMRRCVIPSLPVHAR